MAEKETVETVDKSIKLDRNKEEALKGALQAGYGITPEAQTGGGALKVESLDADIHNLTYGENDFTILPQMLNGQTVEAKSTVEKYITFLRHGKVGHSVFQPEIGIGSVNSPDLKQKTVNMKFLVDVKQQSFAMQIAATVEDAQSINEQDAMVVIGKTIEWGIFYGDADLTSGEKGEGLEFDGLTKLIDSRNHVDLRGGVMTPEVLNKAAILIGKGFGVATDAYMPIGVKADFGNQFLGAQRVIVPSADGTTAGVNVDQFLSARGTIRLNGSTIMDTDNILDTEFVPSPQAPAAPTATAKAVTDAGGKFLVDVLNDAGKIVKKGEVGVEQSYKFVAVGHHGDSRASDEVKATPVNATDGIELTITLSAMQREIPDYVAIYRKDPVSEDYFLIARVATRDIDASTGALKFTDIDDKIPGTADVFVLQMAKSVISLLQFIELSKINLAVVTTATSFGILWSGALALYQPRRAVQLENVRYASNVPNSTNLTAGINEYGFHA